MRSCRHFSAGKELETDFAMSRSSVHSLKIFFSNRYCYASILSPEGRVMASASSRSSGGASVESTSDKKAAAGVGSDVARMALEQGVDTVSWVRGRHRYHGKVEALISSMQQAGVALR